MNKSKIWISDSKKTVTRLKILLGSLAEHTRDKQYDIFTKITKPKKTANILDVGVASNEDIKGTNFFEKKYPFPSKISAATIENKIKLQKKYPKIKVIKIRPNKRLPFKSNYYQIAVSWATLEHVGGFKEQEAFLNELLRVSKNIFVTTPYRGCIYEPHSGLFFVHWLPLSIFRHICTFLKQKFWSHEYNLNPLYVHDISEMNLIKEVKIEVFKMFGVLPSHLIITNIKTEL